MAEDMTEVCPNFMIVPALKQMGKIEQVQGKFGAFPTESPLALQQRLQYLINSTVKKLPK